MEGELVNQIATCCWRLRRLPHIETGLLRFGSFAQEAGRDRTVPLEAEYTVVESDGAPGHGSSPTQQTPAAYAQAMLATAFANQSQHLERLSRYETTIDRRLHRVLHRLQDARRDREANRPPTIGIRETLAAWTRQANGILEARRAKDGARDTSGTSPAKSHGARRTALS